MRKHIARALIRMFLWIAKAWDKLSLGSMKLKKYPKLLRKWYSFCANRAFMNRDRVGKLKYYIIRKL